MVITGIRLPLPSGGTTTRGAAGTSSSSGGTVIGGPYGTATTGAGTSSSSDGTATEVRYGTGTFSSFDEGVVVLGCDSKTSSSTTCMRFTLGTSSSSYIM
jgi:hypothetical protein